MKNKKQKEKRKDVLIECMKIEPSREVEWKNLSFVGFEMCLWEVVAKGKVPLSSQEFVGSL